MKQLIRKILREQEEEIITAPSFSFFLNNWEDVLDWADGRLFRMNGDIDLRKSDITTLGGLVEVGGWLDLFGCENLQSLGKLRSVGVWLNLYNCRNLQSLGELESVGGDLFIHYTKVQQYMSRKDIRGKVDVKGSIFG